MLLTAPLLTQFTRTVGFLPAADLAVGERDLVLTLDLPGLTAEDLEIEVRNDELTVRGERKPREAGDGTSYVYAQRRSARSSTASRSPAASMRTASPPAWSTAAVADRSQARAAEAQEDPDRRCERGA